MDVEEQKSRPTSMATYDEISMERSKSFVKALQELKNMRPQLHSAAEYCEKSYLHSDQKHMVLDNLKEYAVRALVNAVDHLGTVAYKLTNLVEQQTSDVSTVEVKVTCLNQKLLTCQTYMDKEGLRQQQLLAIIPQHHKHYILPNSVDKKALFSTMAQADPMQSHVEARPQVHPTGTRFSPSGSKTVSFNPTPETKTVFRSDFQKTFPTSFTMFHLLDAEESVSRRSSGIHAQLPSCNPIGSPVRSYGVTHKDTVADSRPMTPFRSSDSSRQSIVKAPVRNKSMLSALFVKQRTPKVI